MKTIDLGVFGSVDVHRTGPNKFEAVGIRAPHLTKPTRMSFWVLNNVVVPDHDTMLFGLIECWPAVIKALQDLLKVT